MEKRISLFLPVFLPLYADIQPIPFYLPCYSLSAYPFYTGCAYTPTIPCSPVPSWSGCIPLLCIFQPIYDLYPVILSLHTLSLRLSMILYLRSCPDSALYTAHSCLSLSWYPYLRIYTYDPVQPSIPCYALSLDIPYLPFPCIPHSLFLPCISILYLRLFMIPYLYLYLRSAHSLLFTLLRSLSIYSYCIEGCPDSALHIPLFMILTKYAPTFKETFF